MCRILSFLLLCIYLSFFNIALFSSDTQNPEPEPEPTPNTTDTNDNQPSGDETEPGGDITDLPESSGLEQISESELIATVDFVFFRQATHFFISPYFSMPQIWDGFDHPQADRRGGLSARFGNTFISLSTKFWSPYEYTNPGERENGKFFPDDVFIPPSERSARATGAHALVSAYGIWKSASYFSVEAFARGEWLWQESMDPLDFYAWTSLNWAAGRHSRIKPSGSVYAFFLQDGSIKSELLPGLGGNASLAIVPFYPFEIRLGVSAQLSLIEDKNMALAPDSWRGPEQGKIPLPYMTGSLDVVANLNRLRLVITDNYLFDRLESGFFFDYLVYGDSLEEESQVLNSYGVTLLLSATRPSLYPFMIKIYAGYYLQEKQWFMSWRIGSRW